MFAKHFKNFKVICETIFVVYATLSACCHSNRAYVAIATEEPTLP